MIIAADRTGILPRPVRSKSRPTFRRRKCIQLSPLQQLYWGNGLCARRGIPCHGEYILPVTIKETVFRNLNCWNSWCWCWERILRPPRCPWPWSFSFAQDQQRHNTSQCPAPKCGTHFYVSIFYQPTESSKNAKARHAPQDNAINHHERCRKPHLRPFLEASV